MKKIRWAVSSIFVFFCNFKNIQLRFRSNTKKRKMSGHFYVKFPLQVFKLFKKILILTLSKKFVSDTHICGFVPAVFKIRQLPQKGKNFEKRKKKKQNETYLLSLSFKKTSSVEKILISTLSKSFFSKNYFLSFRYFSDV